MSSLDPDIQRARDRWAAWMRHHQEMHGMSQNALAKKIGVRGSTLTYLLQAGADRSPSFVTLMLSKRLTGYPIDVLLFSDPPSLPKR